MSKASQIRQKAQEFLSKGQTEKAIQEYRRLISIESKNPNLYNELGDIYLRSADKDQAVQNFEKAAVIYERVALYNNAVAVCKKILRIEPEKVETIFKLAELRAKQKLEGEATTYFSQYAELVVASPESLKRSQKDIERILELMGTNETILVKGAEIYEQIGLRYKTAQIYMKLSSMASAQGEQKRQAQYRRKVDELSAGLDPAELDELNKNAPPDAPSGETGAEAGGAPAGREGSSAAVSGASPEAAVQAKSAGDSRPGSDTRAREEGPSGEVVKEPSSGDADESEMSATVNEAVEEAEMVAAMSRGHETFAAGAPSGAQEAPESKAAPVGREAPECGAAPSPVDSCAAAERTEERPSAAPSPMAPGLAGHGDAEGEPNLVEEITSDVEKDDLKSHYDLGMAYLEMGLYTDAIKDFQISSRCAELQLSSMEMIGYCFLKHNQPRLAVKQLTRALEIAKSSGAESLGIHYNLGLAHEMLGELAQAREHFEEVYIVDMSFRDIADKMKKLSTVS